MAEMQYIDNWHSQLAAFPEYLEVFRDVIHLINGLLGKVTFSEAKIFVLDSNLKFLNKTQVVEKLSSG